MVDVCATYSLTAIPWPLSNGQQTVHLEYVLFVATDGIQTYKWSWTHTENYVEYFSRIVPPGNARDINTRLLRGQPVMFPGLFELDQIRHRLRDVDDGWVLGRSLSR